MGDLKLYNTRTRMVERFEPLQAGVVRMYVCGLTPSAQAHLGHARSFLFFDVLRRYLEHRTYAVTYVQNVTDIDDRSIATARERGTSYREIVEGHYAAFKTSMRALGVREPDVEPYATAYIAQIQTMIRVLLELQLAYVAQDGIYYRVSSFARYGALSRRNVDELKAGARIEVDEHKDDPLDFALWKFAKPSEPLWPFDPYHAGRPGWHIECSAMSHELLDRQGCGFDIHGGGSDLIFPHHENEIAQSEPLMAHPPMATFWVHGGLLLFDNKKMSKSLGNFEPLTALLERHDPQAIRLLFLQTGYRKVMNFTDESISAAGVVLDRLKKAYRSLRSLAGDAIGEPRRTGLLGRIEDALDDDMNTAVALAEIVRFASTVETAMHPVAPADALRDYQDVLTLLGIEPNVSWTKEPKVELLPGFIARLNAALRQAQGDTIGASFDVATAQEAIERVIALRKQARARKDWAASDRLRNALAACGIAIQDAKDGTTWSIGGGP